MVLVVVGDQTIPAARGAAPAAVSCSTADSASAFASPSSNIKAAHHAL